MLKSNPMGEMESKYVSKRKLIYNNKLKGLTWAQQNNVENIRVMADVAVQIEFADMATWE